MTASSRNLWPTAALVGVGVVFGLVSASTFDAFDTWLVHGSDWFFVLVVVVLWTARPLEAGLRGGLHCWLHAAVGAWTWGAAAHWLFGGQLIDRADDRFAVLSVSFSIVPIRLWIAPWCLGWWLRRALRRSPRFDEWFAAWQVYTGVPVVDPVDSRAERSVVRIPTVVKLMRQVDRILVGGTPLLPAVARHRIGGAADASLERMLTYELDGTLVPGDRYNQALVAETVGRVFADWEAAIHAGEPKEQRLERLEVTMAGCVRLLLDAEDESWARFRRVVLSLANSLLPTAETLWIREMQQKGAEPATMFRQLVQDRSPVLSEPSATDGLVRLVLAADLHRIGLGVWSLWLMDVGKSKAGTALFRAISAFKGALLARASLGASAAQDEDRMQWLARGAMYVAAARQA